MQQLITAFLACNLRAAGPLVLIAAVSGTGCDKASSGISVSGHASYRGEPLAKGLISFFPATGRVVSAPIADDGSYELSLEPGDYTVTVSLGVELPPGFKEGDRVPPPKVVLPDQYSVRAKSTLKATVAPGHAEPLDFDLK